MQVQELLKGKIYVVSNFFSTDECNEAVSLINRLKLENGKSFGTNCEFYNSAYKNIDYSRIILSLIK